MEPLKALQQTVDAVIYSQESLPFLLGRLLNADTPQKAQKLLRQTLTETIEQIRQVESY